MIAVRVMGGGGEICVYCGDKGEFPDWVSGIEKNKSITLQVLKSLNPWKVEVASDRIREDIR